MSQRKKRNVLRQLAAQLKACPSLDDRITPQRLHAAWERFRLLDTRQEGNLTPFIIIALTLQDEHLAHLLNEAENLQLRTLAESALERYRQLTHPPNPLGKTLAASLKETP